MPDILNTAVNGLNAAAYRAAQDVARIVNASSTATEVPETNSAPDSSSSDTYSSAASSVFVGDTGVITEALVALHVDAVTYAANAQSVKTAQKINQALLDIKV